MIIEPNSDMDLDVYKDWLFEFNNNDDLRNIDFASLLFYVDGGLAYHTEFWAGYGNGSYYSGDGRFKANLDITYYFHEGSDHTRSPEQGAGRG